MAADREAQENELLALSSIYDEDTFTVSEDRFGGQFNASVKLPEGQDFHLLLPESEVKRGVAAGVTTVSRQDGAVLLPITHLPPIVLNFSYGPNYPSSAPPKFTLSCKWLDRSKLSRLCQQLDRIWEENQGSEVVFTWVDYMLDNSLQLLEIASPLELKPQGRVGGPAKRGGRTQPGRRRRDPRRANLDPGRTNLDPGSVHLDPGRTNLDPRRPNFDPGRVHLDPRTVQDSLSSLLFPALVDYDRQQRRRQFEGALHSCDVCLEEKLGGACVRFEGCRHVYCKGCMAQYFSLQIREGKVKFLDCPADKCTSQASVVQVKELVAPELYAKYDDLLLKASLDGMSDIIYCPRLSCQCPVLLEVGQGHMGQCPNCAYAFCCFCKMAYHGISPCRLKADKLEKIYQEYSEATDEGKQVLEQQYGKKTIQRMLEEVQSKAWLQSNSKDCPNCGTSIQKIDGCNKMTCTKCRTNFCWLCQVPLSHASPYSHFNDPDSGCFNLLFQGINFGRLLLEEDQEVDEEWQVVEF